MSVILRVALAVSKRYMEVVVVVVVVVEGGGGGGGGGGGLCILRAYG